MTSRTCALLNEKTSRPRKKNNGLPKRMRAKHGAFCFLAPKPMLNPWNGKVRRWIRLCAIIEGESAMYTKLGQLLQDKVLVSGTMPNLCAEWKKNKLGRYNTDIRDEYGRMADVISEAFRTSTLPR